MRQRPDYIIVGGGSTGCTLAGRLMEDPGTQVALFEQGPADSNPWIHLPATVGGVERLRIADASVMPDVISGNLNSVVIMIGEKAADLIRDRGPTANLPSQFDAFARNREFRGVGVRWKRFPATLMPCCFPHSVMPTSQ